MQLLMSGRPGVHRTVWKTCLVSFLALFAFIMSACTPEASSPSQSRLPDPVPVITLTYQAITNAMNAGDVINHPARARVSPPTLLSRSQMSVSSSARGLALYTYTLSRIQVMRTWEAIHSHDFSANHVWSTFKATSTRYNGTQAIVTGIETLHVDSTVKSNGTHSTLSPAKQAAIALAKQTGHYIADGEVNHGMALINHVVTLSQARAGWVIESDSYVDPLEPGLLADHHTRAKEVQPEGKGSRRGHARSSIVGATYQRSAAINYADTWWSSCNPSADYECFTTQGVDCANFVSQSLYDNAGGALPGDDTWYSTAQDGASVAFVNAARLQQYMVSTFASAHRDDEKYSQALQDDINLEGPGDLVFYSWDGGPIIDHTAISVGVDANNITQVDAHTMNVYHWYWDLQGPGPNGQDEGATYWFVMIANG